MEKITIICPACQKKLLLPKNKGMLEVPCPKCGHVFNYNTGPKPATASTDYVPPKKPEPSNPVEQHGRQLIIKRNSNINGAIVKWSLLLDGKIHLTIGNGDTITIPISSDAHILKVENKSRMPYFADPAYIPAESNDCYVTLRIDNSKQWTQLKGSSKLIGTIDINQKQESGIKGFFANMEKDIQRKKDNEEAEREWIRQNPGTEAICDYLYPLFQEDWPAYNWLKANKFYALTFKIGFSTIDLCYFDSTSGKDVAVQSYSFQEIYSWAGLNSQEAFTYLDKKIHKDELVQQIYARILQHPHMKFSGGLVLKMFS